MILKIFRNRTVTAFVVVLLIALVALIGRHLSDRQETTFVTTEVELGDVKQIVSISGVVESKNTAELAFPVTGVVASVSVSEGQIVTQGETLIRLDQTVLQAERDKAKAKLAREKANRDELIRGPRAEAKKVTALGVTIAKSDIERIKREETEKVNNAGRILLSADLIAFNDDPKGEVASPIITGTYTCTKEGVYTLQVFKSKTDSGYSYRLSGLENDTALVNINQSNPLGTCGLRVQFTPGFKYSDTTWTISVPNTSSKNYVANLNQLGLTKKQTTGAIATAYEAIALAKQKQELENAGPEKEALKRAAAAIAEAEAELKVAHAQLAKYTMKAPFSGVITDVDVLPGEIVTTNPVVTLLAEDNFYITARVPEIDISRIFIGQTAQVVFDAKVSEVLDATVSLISPIATEIDGVSYFKATLTFSQMPPWIRSGLNADIDIITDIKKGVNRLPKRFLITAEDGTTTVLKSGAEGPIATPVKVLFTGNDGFVAISGVSEGDQLIAP